MKVLSPQPQTQLDLWSHLKVSQSGQGVSVQIPFPFYVDVLKLAQASGFYSKLLSAGKDLTKLGGGAGKRRISNYRAEEGISQRGHCIDREAHIERGQAGSGWLSQDPEAYSSNPGPRAPTMATGKLIAPTGGKGWGQMAQTRPSPMEVCGGPKPVSLADPILDGHAELGRKRLGELRAGNG